jgi:acyl-CoA hydrolase
MRFHTRKWVKPEDLNANGTLFGGKLLAWIDEEAALYSIVQLENSKVVTKFMSEINFMSAAKQGDIVEIGLDVIQFGKSSLVLKCEVRNMMTRETIITIDNITMVNLGEDEKPKAVSSF